jgi:RHS repeat-associated protein
VVEGGQLYFVRTDHIGRPVFATNDAGQVVWSATYHPFGGVRVTQGTPIGLRFPGQWFQAESGLHQNWMRDYDPTTGRYIQPDPLGLDGGVALYGYALQSPMVYIDPRGENPAVVGGALLCARFPALCKEIPRACAGAVIAGATWLGIINNSESGGDELGPISPPTEGTQACDDCDKCKPRYEQIRSVADVIRTRFAQRAANVLGFAPGSEQWINHEMSIAQRQNQLKRLIRSARSAGCFDIDPADIEVSTRHL